MHPQKAPGLDVTTTSISRGSLEVNAESILHTNGSSTITTPSLQVKTDKVSSVLSLSGTPLGRKSSPLERIAAQLHANKFSKNAEVKTEAVTTSGLTSTNSTPRRSPDAGQPSQSGSVVTQTVNKMSVSPVDVTTSHVTTAASTTTVGVDENHSVLGKRFRRQSTKYEDYDQQTITVCHVQYCIGDTVSVGGTAIITKLTSFDKLLVIITKYVASPPFDSV